MHSFASKSTSPRKLPHQRSRSVHRIVTGSMYCCKLNLEKRPWFPPFNFCSSWLTMLVMLSWACCLGTPLIPVPNIVGKPCCERGIHAWLGDSIVSTEDSLDVVLNNVWGDELCITICCDLFFISRFLVDRLLISLFQTLELKYQTVSICNRQIYRQ